MAFEDIPLTSADKDYNDLVAAVTVTGCDNGGSVCDPKQELVTNGTFETPTVGAGTWNIIASGTGGIGWFADWLPGASSFNSVTRPVVANIELQSQGLGGWMATTSVPGTQWTELDSDWDGPSGGLNGEPGSVAIWQDISTIPGQTYHVGFDFSPRPDIAASQNKVEALWGNILGATAGPVSVGGNTMWSRYGYDFVATTTSTRLTFRDAGTSNDSFGTFLDNVSATCVPTTPPPQDKATIVATKIVCEHESDLPNWGDGAGPDISSTTAAAFLAQHESCHLARDWNFETAPNGTPNPGSNGFLQLELREPGLEQAMLGIFLQNVQ
jgi:hypothetical protein